jgi:hypothetical protein
MTIRDLVWLAHDHGLSVFPVLDDGSKRPDGPWKEHQARRATEAELNRWFGVEGPDLRTGFAVICGDSSGGLEVIDFDDPSIFDRFLERAQAVGLGDLVGRVVCGCSVQTPRPGMHIYYVCDEIAGNQTLARNAANKPLIETRGRGGYVIGPGSNGRVHPNGGRYEFHGGGFEKIERIDARERAQLLNLARSFDESVKLEATAGWEIPVSENSWPGDDFAAQTSWREILDPHGWTLVHTDQRTGEQFWKRPGKSDPGWSATVGYKGSDLLYVFSTATPFESEKAYTKFTAHATLNHNGDARATARDLISRGFGVKGTRRSAGCDREFDDDSDIERLIAEAEPWPDPPDPSVYHGPIGEAVQTIAPNTEADPVAVLVQLLVGFGNLVGRGAHLLIEDTPHFANEFVVIIGESSAARKGTSWRRVLKFLGLLEIGAIAKDQGRLIARSSTPTWVDFRIASGSSTGEGLIHEIRDPVEKVDKDGNEIIVDDGEPDKRLLCVESEFGSTIRILGRDGNTLSGIVRQAWDSPPLLRTLTRHSPLRASFPHVSIIGHITAHELRTYLELVHVYNGLGNRFLWICARRARILPRGGRLSPETDAYLRQLAKSLRQRSLDHVRRRGVSEVEWSEDAEELWNAEYERLTTPPPGLLGAITARNAPLLCGWH